MLDSVRLSTLFVVLFSVVAVQLPFWPVWLAAQGLDAAQVGLVVSFGYWSKLLADPLAGVLADRTGTRRRAMIVVSLLALGAASVLLVERHWAVVFAASLVWAGAFSALVPLGDNLALLMARARGLDYGRLRLWGSVGFVAAAASAGQLLTGHPTDTILHLLLGGLAATVLVCALLPEAPAAPSPRPARRVSPWPLLGHPAFWLFLAAAGLVQASHGVLYAFGSIHWKELGLSSQAIGLLWVEGVIFEIALFGFGRPLVDRLGAVRMLLVASLAGMLRWTLLTGAETLPWIVLAQALHGLSFGAAHLAAMRFIVEAVPTSHSATGQTLYTGIALGIGYGVVIAATGPLYAAVGSGAFLAMAGLCVLSALAAWLLSRRWRPGQELDIGPFPDRPPDRPSDRLGPVAAPDPR